MLEGVPEFIVLQPDVNLYLDSEEESSNPIEHFELEGEPQFIEFYDCIISEDIAFKLDCCGIRRIDFEALEMQEKNRNKKSCPSRTPTPKPRRVRTIRRLKKKKESASSWKNPKAATKAVVKMQDNDILEIKEVNHSTIIPTRYFCYKDGCNFDSTKAWIVKMHIWIDHHHNFEDQKKFKCYAPKPRFFKKSDK